MKIAKSIIAHTALIITLTLSQTTIASADKSGETTNVTDAMKLYARALPMDMDSKERAQLLNQTEALLKKAIKENPQSLDAHRKLIGVYLLKQDYSNGISTMQDAITLSPKDPKLFIGLAFLYEHSGALEYAIAMLDQALALDPGQKLAMEYKIAIQKKIDARNMNELHKETNMGSHHGKATGDISPHPAIEPTR